MFKDFKTFFPIFLEENNTNLVYLDSAATTQKPNKVINAIEKYYRTSNANPHRGGYGLSIESTNSFEAARDKVRAFINAASSKEIIFTKGTTEGINIIAQTYGRMVLEENEEIVIGISEHHSNLIPWQQLAKEKKAKLKYMYLDDNYRYTDEEISLKITSKSKIVAIAHVSNVLGTSNPIEKIIERAHSVGAKVVIDGAQAISHKKVDVKALDADFYVFSGHKMFGPMGIGVLYGKAALLNSMPPLFFGGDMIEYVYEQETTFNELPYKFEGGTQNVEGAVGLGAAIDFINEIGINNIFNHEKELTSYALEKLSSLPFIRVIGAKENIHGVISFIVDGVHPHDVSTILDSKNICIRAGNHCAQPLMRFLEINSTCRVSLSIYNTKDDIDALMEGLILCRRIFGYGHE